MDANESAACVGAACRSSVGTATEGPVAVRLGPINYEQQFLLLVMLLLLLLISQSLQAGTLAQFRTVLGDLEVELFEADKPVTVQNFIRYVQSGVYSNMFFHRYVPGFVIQGGGYFTTNRSTASPSLAAVDGFGPITNEFNVGARRSNVLGTLAMAKLGGDPNSASSEWFFNLADNSANLDQQNGGFTVFGRVVGSTQVLNQLTNLIRVDAGGPFTELPVLNFPPSYEDLVYVDITLLDVRVARGPTGGAEISWISVTNRPNQVEFTEEMPPRWQSLVATNGTGARLQVADPQSGSRPRFYRVRVEY